jgi:DNA-binding CsgD family transcriptional regulator
MQKKLTKREQNIFEMLLEGYPPKAIAHKLNVVYSTVDYHRNNIYKKLGVKNIQELLVKYKNYPNKTYTVKEKPEAAFTMQIIDTVELYANRWDNPKEGYYGEGWFSYDRIKLHDIYTGKFTDLFSLKPGGWKKFLLSGSVDRRLQWASLQFTYLIDDVTIPINARSIILAGGKNERFADIGPGKFSKVEIEIQRDQRTDIDALLESTQGEIQVQFLNVMTWFSHEVSSLKVSTFDSGERIPDDARNGQVMATVRNLKIEPFVDQVD